MTGLRLLVCSVVLNSVAFAAARAQLQHFNPVSSTGQNASLVLPSSAGPNIDGEQLEVGDEVGVFSKEGLNVGAGTWTGSNIAIVVWGDDALTTEVDGIVPGDSILIRVWDQSGDVELDDVVVTYSVGNGMYAPDAILELASLDAQADLPVELANFDAVVSGDDVRLSWTTLGERDNAGFEVQQLRDDSQFRPLGFVEGAGKSDEPATYTYNVPDLPPGRHTFRLKQIDLSHEFHFGPLVEVLILAETPVLSGNYPNPVELHTTISFALPRESDVTLTLFDVLGRQVGVLFSGSVEAGTHAVPINATDLASGVYFYRLTAGDYVEARRMDIVK